MSLPSQRERNKGLSVCVCAHVCALLCRTNVKTRIMKTINAVKFFEREYNTTLNNCLFPKLEPLESWRWWLICFLVFNSVHLSHL